MLNKFEEPTKRILSIKIQQTIQDNHKLIDKDLFAEFQKFVSDVPPTVKFKEANKFESTEDTDIRIRKLNELDERLKNSKKILKKKIKRTDNYGCELHQILPSTKLLDHLNGFLEKDLSAKDLESVIKNDEDVMQQHAANLEKISRFMLVTEGFKVDQPNVPAAELINNCTTLLREVIKILYTN